MFQIRFLELYLHAHAQIFTFNLVTIIFKEFFSINLSSAKFYITLKRNTISPLHCFFLLFSSFVLCFVLLCCVLGPDPALLMAYSWLCAQELYLEFWGGTYGMPEIYSVSARAKKYLIQCTISPFPFHFLMSFK